jgi:heme/copper-type cytochrome/quinol oxidase subunit 4
LLGYAIVSLVAMEVGVFIVMNYYMEEWSEGKKTVVGMLFTVPIMLLVFIIVLF